MNCCIFLKFYFGLVKKIKTKGETTEGKSVEFDLLLVMAKDLSVWRVNLLLVYALKNKPPFLANRRGATVLKLFTKCSTAYIVKKRFSYLKLCLF